MRLGALRVSADPEADALLERMDAVLEELVPFEDRGDPPPFEARLATVRAAGAARALVDEIERLGIGEDRLGKKVRNLFECLGLPAEGAQISRRAGEEPGSLIRQA